MNPKHYATSATDIADRLDLRPLDALSEDQRSVLAVLMARLAERSYRRGFQQGATIAQKRPRDLPTDLHDWRYGASTDVSVWGDSSRAEAALDRLFMENDSLRAFLPRRPSGAFDCDFRFAAFRLSAFAADKRDAGERGNRHAEGEAAQQIKALGIELSIADPAAMMKTYDDAQENFGGAMATQGVSPLWNGIGAWAD